MIKKGCNTRLTSKVAIQGSLSKVSKPNFVEESKAVTIDWKARLLSKASYYGCTTRKLD